MRRCGQCDKTEAVVFTTLPAQVRCSVDGKLHEMSEQCKIEFVPLIHACWEDTYNDGNWHCSACGAIVEKDEQDRHNWYRCYHCGALMDEEKKDDC